MSSHPLLAGLCSLALASCTGAIGDLDSGPSAEQVADAAFDAGVVPDSGVASDGGVAPDAGASPADAGVDRDAGYDAGPPLACSVGLAARVRVTEVSVGALQVSVGTDDGWATNRPLHLAALADGSKVAWSSPDGNVHVTPLRLDDTRAGPDFTVPGESVRGFVAHADGSVALLVVRGQEMHFVKLSAAGTVAADVTLIGDRPATEDGAKFVHFWGHQGRLRWSGTQYVAYFGHNQNFGALGMHQGDLLRFLDKDGVQIGGMWEWGCSHSLDLRLALAGENVGAICLSDAYPSKAILFNHYGTLQNEPSGGANGYSNARLGGFTVPVDGGFALTFLSDEGRCAAPIDGGCASGTAARDLGFLRLDATGQVLGRSWLTQTDGFAESTAQLGTYGSALLAAWTGDAGTLLAVLENDGTLAQGPVPAPVFLSAKNDFVAMPNGDTAWAFAWGDYTLLKIVRVRGCR